MRAAIQERMSYPHFHLLFLLLVQFLCFQILSGCKAGDIGSSSSSAAATVDNSNDDHHVSGETQCETKYDISPEGTCVFSQVCNGVEVNSGDFVITATSPCPTPAPEVPAQDVSSGETATLNQGSAL